MEVAVLGKKKGLTGGVHMSMREKTEGNYLEGANQKGKHISTGAPLAHRLDGLARGHHR
jgi:hypothetical protein